MSTAFAPLAQVVAEGVGVAALPLVVVSHPVGDRDAALVKGKGVDIAEQCARVLTTPVTELQAEFEHKTYPLPDALKPR